MAGAKKPRFRCSFRYERKLQRQGFGLIAGLDEVGRGALCGPVVAAAVVFARRPPIPGINDSKKLNARRREQLLARILKHAVGCSVAIVSAEDIDRINIYQATIKAMKMALDRLSPIPDFALIDGRPIRGLGVPSLGIIKGDSRSISIAAASILAKVTRDSLMKSYASMYPMYDWRRNKGYACKKHFEALHEHGPTSIHRRSFKPVFLKITVLSGIVSTQQLSLE